MPRRLTTAETDALRETYAMAAARYQEEVALAVTAEVLRAEHRHLSTLDAGAAVVAALRGDPIVMIRSDEDDLAYSVQTSTATTPR